MADSPSDGNLSIAPESPEPSRRRRPALPFEADGGDWKVLHILKAAGGTSDWQLFNLREDPAELHDVSSQLPEKRAAMLKRWDEHATTNGVVLTVDGPFAKRAP